MTSAQRQFAAGTVRVPRPRPLRPWPALVPVDAAPPPKPLVMGRQPQALPPSEPLALGRMRTRWKPDTATGVPRFPIEPANDPVRHLADDDRLGLTLLTLVLCVTVAIALLGFGLQALL